MLKAKLLGATAAAEVLAIEDVFSTYLYSGNGSTRTITNGIDLAGEGGLVWIKDRDEARENVLQDTERGTGVWMSSNLTNGNLTNSNYVTAFNSNGFSVGNESDVNFTGEDYASWTFRKAERFFDVVTYTGTGSNRTIAHNLGVVPGCIIVKRRDATANWQVYHRGNTAAPETDYLVLNSTAATVDDNTRWNDTLPTSTVFSLGTATTVNASGGTYVAYVYAHDPLGPSGDGSDGLIACGGYAGSSSAQTITLGWEPQWLLIKSTDTTGWLLFDNMRGLPVGGNDQYLLANSSAAEATSYASYVSLTSTGFRLDLSEPDVNSNGRNYIYIAIRRGPMREPTVGTEVFAPVTRTGTGGSVSVSGVGFPPDLYLPKRRNTTSGSNYWFDRLRGPSATLASETTGAEYSSTRLTSFDQDGVTLSSVDPNASGSSYVDWMFRRAPGFFDVVAYSGTGSARTVPHNLGVAPEMMIVKRRDATSTWPVWIKPVFDISSSGRLLLNETTERQNSSAAFNSTAPTGEVFTLGTSVDTNGSGATYIAYLFATLAGVSKVGSYTGNGSSQTINCGFTSGARFILIKRTDSTGDWYVWDTARGIVTGNDPHLSLNTTAAEVTSDDTIDPDSTGFIVNQVAATNVNVNTATYIYFAVS